MTRTDSAARAAEWSIGRSRSGWHAIYDTNAIICAEAFGAGRARIIVQALAAEHGDPIREQSDDDLKDPMFTEAALRDE